MGNKSLRYIRRKRINKNIRKRWAAKMWELKLAKKAERALAKIKTESTDIEEEPLHEDDPYRFEEVKHEIDPLIINQIKIEPPDREKLDFICAICGLDYAFDDHLEKHIYWVHRPLALEVNSGAEIYCSKCRKWYTKECDFENHWPCFAVQGQCPICNIISPTKYHFLIHDLTWLNQKSYQCNLCNINTALFPLSQINIHMQLVHKKRGIYECNHCQIIFPVKTSLTQHVYKEHDGMFYKLSPELAWIQPSEVSITGNTIPKRIDLPLIVNKSNRSTYTRKSINPVPHKNDDSPVTSSEMLPVFTPKISINPNIFICNQVKETPLSVIPFTDPIMETESDQKESDDENAWFATKSITDSDKTDTEPCQNVEIYWDKDTISNELIPRRNTIESDIELNKSKKAITYKSVKSKTKNTNKIDINTDPKQSDTPNTDKSLSIIPKTNETQSIVTETAIPNSSKINHSPETSNKDKPTSDTSETNQTVSECVLETNSDTSILHTDVSITNKPVEDLRTKPIIIDESDSETDFEGCSYSQCGPNAFNKEKSIADSPEAEIIVLDVPIADESTKNKLKDSTAITINNLAVSSTVKHLTDRSVLVDKSITEVSNLNVCIPDKGATTCNSVTEVAKPSKYYSVLEQSILDRCLAPNNSRAIDLPTFYFEHVSENNQTLDDGWKIPYTIESFISPDPAPLFIHHELPAKQPKRDKNMCTAAQIRKLCKIFICDICDMDFLTAGDRRRHSLLVHRPWTIEIKDGAYCFKCRKWFKDEFLFQGHAPCYIFAVKKRCPICYVEKPTMEHFKLHNVVYYPLENAYWCKLCEVNTTFFRLEELNTHRQETHKKNGVFECLMCNNTFENIKIAKDHILDVHQKQGVVTGVNLKTTSVPLRLYNCKICSKTFFEKRLFDKHHQVHEGALCSVCGQSFKSKGLMFEHLNKHTKQQIFECKECDSTFAMRKYLIQHAKIHKVKKNFICEECHQSFTQQTSLIYHMAAHTQENIFKCALCDIKFDLQSKLTSHMQIHIADGTNPHVCKVCGKNFSHKCNLLVHMRMHPDNKKNNDKMVVEDKNESSEEEMLIDESASSEEVESNVMENT